MSNHVFQASGEACPICAALDGNEVSAGFTPHEKCMCQTIPKDNESECTWTFEGVGNQRYGNGSFDVITGIEVTVICPDGSEFGQTGQYDGASSGAQDAWDDHEIWAEGLEDAAEEIATELCSQCQELEPFLCC